MPSTIPQRAEWRRRLATPGWATLPLRAFLGGTFVFAGLQKLADRNFFRASSPSSIQSQMHAYMQQSPVGGLLGGAAHHAVLMGVIIALAELAVGAGTLLGLWSQVAAIGGALLSLGFLLTVSWHTHPYYYGADLVFLVAWLPLVLLGDGGVLSLSAYLRERNRLELGLPVVGPVSIEFTVVRSLCRGYEAGACRFRHGDACAPAPCPVLKAGPRPATTVVEDLDRRAFLATARAAAVVAGGAAALGVVAATLGRIMAPASSDAAVHSLGDKSPALGRKTDPTATTAAPGTTTTTAPGSGPVGPTAPATTAPPSTTPVTVRPAGTAVGRAADVPSGGAASFTDPASGVPAYVLHTAGGEFKAFSAVCTHAGCRVQYSGSEFACPCHGARFSATDGSAIQGPARRPLDTIAVTVGPDGQIYVDG